MADHSLLQMEIGTFKGFAESGLEFTAEIISPYHTEYRPHIGEFVLVTLTSASAILGRITRFFPMGVLSSGEGDEYLAEMRRRNREVPEDLKEAKLRYSVRIKLLGGIELRHGEFVYHPSIRDLPHLGARVGTLSEEALRFVCALGKEGGHSVPIGHYSLGDQVYNGRGSADLPVMFDLDHLVARRTFVFARAGYGKSNLIKLLVSRLYEHEQPGGMIIFDPEGEYAFRDKRDRPGLADVPFLRDKLVVYTNRRVSAPFDRWVAGNVKLNLCELRPSEVINQCIAESKQELVFANMIRGLGNSGWRSIIALLETQGYRADEKQIAQITGMNPAQDGKVLGAIKNNLTPVITALHSGQSDLIQSVGGHLAAGRIVVVDISLMSSTDGYRVAGLILNELLHRNQQSFIAGSEGAVLPIIAVMEEAQSVLPRGVSDDSPFVRWVKEGRKYSLGAILVTQQPGSIAPELLSQGDNFFAFHLLSAADLRTLQDHNAHYSNDILASILNEPIKGNAYLWSAPDQPFVLPARIHNFESWVSESFATKGISPTVVETPVELRRREQPGRQDELDRLLIEALQASVRIVLHTVSALDGTRVGSLLAIEQWNMLLQMGELLEAAPVLLAEYCATMAGGRKMLREEVCLQALDRLGLLHGKAASDDAKTYFLIDGSRLGRTARSSDLRLHRSSVVDLEG